MRFGIKKDFDWEYLGAVLAQEGDDVQAKFFKSFVKECSSWGTKHQVELQLASVNHLLTDEGKEVLGMIGYVENE